METNLVKTKYSDETFYVQYNDKLDIWENWFWEKNKEIGKVV